MKGALRGAPVFVGPAREQERQVTCCRQLPLVPGLRETGIKGGVVCSPWSYFSVLPSVVMFRQGLTVEMRRK